MKVNIFDAKNRLSQLIKSARAGEEVLIANRGAPVARLVAVDEAETAVEGDPRTILGWLASHPLPLHARRPAAEIDAAIDEERSAWD
jgi:prevent-host-death family protein